MPLPAEFLDRLRSMNRIEDVVSGYVTLKRANRVSKCLCPFHSEKTPSCTIYPDSDSFYCFGCGAGGDVISFIMKIENLNYIEAVRLLAQRSGLDMPEDSRQGDNYTKNKQRLYDMNRAAAKYFYSNLKTPQGKKGLEYLLKRGLTPETIKKFGLGVAIDSWNGLKYALMSQGFSERELIDAGLITISGKGKNSFDFFMNRVMFPFFDLRGNVIAFGGRTLGDDNRKYLNSKETLVFKKNRTLFCLNFAKGEAAKKKQLLLCEGNMDVISLHQAGFENAVATCGTAITPEHARIMSQYCNEVIICYDSDQAGQKATSKALNILSDVGIGTKVIKMQGAKDPDEYIKKFGAPAFAHLINSSEGAINFRLEKCAEGLDLENDVEKLEYLKRCFNVLSDISGSIEREFYISKIAAEYGVSKAVVEEEVANRIRRKTRSREKQEWTKTVTFADRTTRNADDRQYAGQRETKAQKGIISYLLLNPDKAEYISRSLAKERFITPIYRKIYVALLNKIKNEQDYSISSFHDELSGDEMGKISEIAALSKEQPETEQTAEDYINVLNNYQPKGDDNDISDEDLLSLQRNLRNKKGNNFL